MLNEAQPHNQRNQSTRLERAHQRERIVAERRVELLNSAGEGAVRVLVADLRGNQEHQKQLQKNPTNVMSSNTRHPRQSATCSPIQQRVTTG